MTAHPRGAARRWLGRLALISATSAAVFDCASGVPQGDADPSGAGLDGPLGTTKDRDSADVTPVQGCSQTINGRTWCSRWLDGNYLHPVQSSTTYDPDTGLFTVTTNAIGMAFGSNTTQTDGAPQADGSDVQVGQIPPDGLLYPTGPKTVDGITYVYTNLNGPNVDLIVHVKSVTSDNGPPTLPNCPVATGHAAEVGVMLRGEVPSSCLPPLGAKGACTGWTNDHWSDDTLPPYGPVGGLAWLGNRMSPDGPACQNGYSPDISSWILAGRINATSDMGWGIYNTRVNPNAPPSPTAPGGLYLRVTRIGNDYAFAQSLDGRTWTPRGGGSLPSSTPNVVVGFFASAFGNDGACTTDGSPPSRTATFEIVSINDAPLPDRHSSWLGTTWGTPSIDLQNGSASHGVVTHHLDGFYVDPNTGVSYKMAASVDGGSSIIPFNPSAGTPLPVFEGTTFGWGRPRAITGDGSFLYVGVSNNADGQSNPPTLPDWLERLSLCSPTAIACDLATHCPSFPPLVNGVRANTFGTISGIGAAPPTNGVTNIYVSDIDNRVIHKVAWPSAGGGCSTPTHSSFPAVFANGTRFTPGPPAVDTTNGHVWVLQTTVPTPLQDGASEFIPTTGLVPRAVCFNLDGTSCAAPYVQPLDLSTFGISNPTAISITASGQVLITDNGSAQNVRVCTFGSSGASCPGPDIGAAQGVFGNTPSGAYPGPGLPARFFSLVGAGKDSAGNAYVGHGAPLVSVTKVAPNGTVVWTQHGIGKEPGGFDPGTGATVNASGVGKYYTLSRRMNFLFGQSAGREWMPNPAKDPATVTWNPFFTGSTGQPAVAQILQSNPPWAAVRLPSGQGDRDIRSLDLTAAPIVRELTLNGVTSPFMFLPYRYDSTNRIEIFRFQGETAVPCGAIDSLRNGTAWQLSVWNDANQDGHRPSLAACSSGSDPQCATEVGGFSTLPQSDFASYRGYPSVDVDKNGDIWLSFQTQIVRLIHSGLAPVPTLAGVSQAPIPSDFLKVDHVSFDALGTTAGDLSGTLYVLGWASGTARGGDECPMWSGQHRALGAYTIASSGVDMTKRWVVELPMPRAANADEFVNHVADSDCRTCNCCQQDAQTGAVTCSAGCSCASDWLCSNYGTTHDSSCTCNPPDSDWDYNSLAIAGNYVFIQEELGGVHVHRKLDGADETRLFPGVELEGAFGIHPADDRMQAIALSTGEYVVTAEDEFSISRTEIERWTPQSTTMIHPNVDPLTMQLFKMVGAI